MNDWLGEMRRRGRLTWTMVEAARLWASDVAELGRGGCGIVQYDRPAPARSRSGEADIMGLKVRERVRDVERRLGGAGSPSFRVAWAVAVEGRTAGEAAEVLAVRTTTGMDLLRLALPVVAQVYGLRQDGPIRAA